MMTRSVLFAVMLAFAALTVGFTSMPAQAQEKKGILGFFNRQTDNSAEKGGPIHMSPGTEGSAKDDSAKAYGYGKNQGPSARYEDSPINAENERSKAMMAKFLAEDKAQAQAEGAALNEQMRAERAYNEQVAKKEQAEKLAQSAQKMSAGAKPAGMGMGAAQAKALADQKSLGSTKTSNGMIVPPSSSVLPQSASPKGAKRPQGLFNRVDDED